MFVSIIFVSIVGFVISLYARHVENRIKREIAYKPACDISDHISCSKPLLSPYGNIFYISNSVAGIIFYGITIVLAFLEYPKALLAVATAGLAVSLYLAYILFFKIRSLCPLCVGLYCVNIVLWVLSLYLYMH